MTGAEELRTAAATLRARATAARRGTPTPWTPGDPADPELYWIALMDPGMGPLLADWLDHAAETHAPAPSERGAVRCTCGGCSCGDLHWPCASITAALAVARAINSKTKEQP